MHFRRALRKDLESLIEMLADDELGKLREDYQLPLPSAYEEAFAKIDQDNNQHLTVVTNDRGELIGMLQLTFIPYLTYQGGVRAQVEGVRIKKSHRGQGTGEQMMAWAIEKAKQEGAHVLQLTTDKLRPDAIRFYEKLGFTASHEGMKLHLPQNLKS
ncbi:GNAT family N-acetyltransferase [bacterium SCSIO 12741]|nr:GNAT family N-acetyltransferase [bacterium SCSIO 12741]